jgi:hypothetical protein
VGAIVSGSLALLADAGHMLTDVAGLSLAVAASVLAARPATPERTWGSCGPRSWPQRVRPPCCSPSGCSCCTRACADCSSHPRWLAAP